MIHSLLAVLWATCGQTPERFEIRLMDGEPHLSVLHGISLDGTLSFAVGEKQAGGTWYSLRREGKPNPAEVRAAHVELANGDRIRGTVIEADGDAVRLRLAMPGTDQVIRLPFSAIRAIWTVRRPASDPKWLQDARKRDVIQTRSGDQILGAITSIDPGKNIVTYQVEGKDQQLDFTKLAAIGFNTELARVRKPKGPYYRLTLADGSRMSVLSITYDGKVWTAQTPFKETVQIPFGQMLAIDVEQGKASWLADVTPAKYQCQVEATESIPLAVNRCVTGEFLRLRTGTGEGTFDRGVGLQSECAVTYSLGGKYRRFEALAGLDAKSGVRGDAILVVLVDGKEQALPSGGKLTLAGGPIAVRVNLTQAKELTIVIKQGNGGTVQDHVNLVEARLVP